MQQLILLFHVLVCVSLLILVLLHQGKGSDIGAAFGAGASQTVFGSQGSGSFLVKMIGLLATLFFATSLVLSYLTASQQKAAKIAMSNPLQNVMEKQSTSKTKTVLPVKSKQKSAKKS